MEAQNRDRSYGKMKIINYGNLDKMMAHVFNRVKSASGRMALTSRWCGVATLNAHAHSEN
jgi:hypothetical protein